MGVRPLCGSLAVSPSVRPDIPGVVTPGLIGPPFDKHYIEILFPRLESKWFIHGMIYPVSPFAAGAAGFL